MFLFLIFTYLWVFQLSFHYWFLVSFLLIEKHTFYNFSLLKCVKTSFVALHGIYPGECSVCTRKDYILLGGVFIICLSGPVDLVLFPSRRDSLPTAVLSTFPGGTVSKKSTCSEDLVLCLCWEDPLEEGMTIHSSILAWRIAMDRETW